MTDRGLLSQFDPEATGVPSPPSPPSPQKPAEADGSLFAQFDPEKVGAVGPQPESTAFGAARRAAGRGVLPAAGGIVGFGAGAEIGGVAGMAVGGPVGAFVGALGGGLIGSMGASWGVSKAQDAALASMPESWQDALGQSESQRIADETKHPMASFLGGVVPFAVTMRPGASAPFLAKLPENATALQRILANPATARVFGGGLMGGMELGTEFAHGDVDWRKVAISTGMGLVLNKQTKLGDTIMGVGQSGARAVIPSGTMRRYEEMRGSPTLAQAADEKVAGAGVTEEVFHGTERQDPGAERAAQNTARTEAVAFGEPEVKVDPHDVARRMEPELFARRDALEAQIDSFRRTIAEHHNPPESAFVDAEARAQRIQDELTAHIEAQNGYVGGKEARRLRAELRDAQGVVEELRGRQARYSAGLAEETPELAAIRQRLVAADMEMRDLGREIAASYRRAEEHIGGGHSVPAPAPLPETPPTRFWSLPEMIAATDGSQRPAGVSAPIYAPISEVPDAVFTHFPDMQTTEQGVLSVNSFTLEERAAMDRAGLIKTYKTKEGESYEGVDTEPLWREREVRAKRDREKPRSVITQEQRDAAIERRASLYDRVAQEQEALGELGDTEKVAEYRAKAAEIRAGKGKPVERAAGESKPAPETAGSGQAVDDRAGRYSDAQIAEIVSDSERIATEAEAAGDADFAATFRAQAEKFRAIQKERAGAAAATITRAPDAAGTSKTAGSGRATTFQTAKGSTYEVHDDGTTTRTKAARADVGHEGDEGLKPRSAKTVYIASEDGQRLALPQGTARIIDHGDGTLSVATKNKDGQWGIAPSGRNVPFTTQPEKGRTPVELWKPETVNGLPAYRTIHLGNEITSVGAAPETAGTRAKPVEPAPAATAPTGDRTAIVADVKQRLMRTGMREDEAAANAEIWGAYYETRAARFAGARGSALDLYRASAPDIAGPTGRLSPFEIGPAAAKSRLAPPPAEPPKVGGRTLADGSYRPGELFQAQASGKIRIVPGKRSLITLAAKSDASTFMHESGHQFLEDLMADAMHAAAPAQLKDDADTVLRWLGVKSAKDIKTKHHEKFARGFEQYLREGVAPSTGLVHVFAQFKTWLTAIYQTLRGLGKPISDDIRGVFDRMLAETPERTVIVPERERAPLPHETHERDAELTHPAEADAAADRIRFETDSAQAAPPQEIAHEIAAALQKDAAAQAGRAGQPAGEAGRGAPAAGDMALGGAGPGPVAGGEPVGARSQPELRGGGEAAAERAGVRGDDRGPGTGDGLGDAPFATRPTHRVDAASESPFVDKAGNIRVENLTTREDVAQAIRDSAEANNDFIADRRGVVTDGQVMDLAADLGMRYTDLLQRKVGEAFNAEQVVAARKLLVQSATDVAAAMKKAATGTEQDVIAYAQARDRHHLIQAQIAGITAEAGRALRAFRDISMTGEAAAADQIVRQATGRTLFQLRREAQLGLALETPQQVSAWMRATQDHSFGRMLLEFWINSLLSGPSTHATNMLGNTILAMWKAIPETAAAAAIGKVRRALGRDGETVQFGEIGASFKARSQSQAAALKAGLDSFERSHSALLPGEKPEAIQGVDPDYMFAAHAQIDPNAKFSDTMASAFGIARGLRDGFLAAGGLLKGEGVAGAPAVGLEYSPRGAIPNVTVKGVTVLPTGDLARLPSRFLSAVDSYFKATNYSMDIAAQAYRAAATAGLEGEAFTARVAYLRANPTPEMMQAAIAETQALTLMGRGGEFTRRLSQLVGYEMPGGLKPLKFVDPFVRVASNIINETMMKRSPLGVLSPEIRKDLSGANGTIAQDKAMARMLVGTATAVTAGLLAAEGYVSGSGPTDRNDAAMWRLAGNQAHSVRIGEMWYDIHRLGPVGMLISLAADLYEMSHTAAEGDFSEAAAHLHHAITQNVLDQSFMKGPADLIKAIDDPGRYGANYINNFLSSFLPYSVGMGQVARAMDPYSRQARTVVDAMKAKVPGLSTEVMPRRDIWGEPIERPKAVGIPVASAIYGRKINNDPVNRALLDLGVSPAPVQKKIRNVELTPQQYDDFSRIAGRTAKMRLDTIVTSAQWQNWPDYVREQVVRETVKQARETARGMMMMKYPQIMKDAVAAKREAMGGGLSVSARGM